MSKPLILGLCASIAIGLAASALAQTSKDKAKAPAAPVKQAAVLGQKFRSPLPVSVARGEKIFVQYCAVCHGMHGKGDGPRAAFFADIQYIPDLALDGFLDGRDDELLTGIREGLSRYDEPAIIMPQFKNILSENDIRSALLYVKTFAPPAKKPAPAAKKK